MLRSFTFTYMVLEWFYSLNRKDCTLMPLMNANIKTFSSTVSSSFDFIVTMIISEVCECLSPIL